MFCVYDLGCVFFLYLFKIIKKNLLFVELYMFFVLKKRIYLFLNKFFLVCYVSI